MDLGGVLISISQAIEPVGGYTTESVTHGQCDGRPMVRRLPSQPMTGTNLYCLVNRGIVCEQLAQSRYLRPLGCKSDALTSTPPRHSVDQR